MSKQYVPTIKKSPTRPDHKFCTKCDIEKPFAEFKPLKGGRYGLHSWCVPCLGFYHVSRYVPSVRQKRPVKPRPIIQIGDIHVCKKCMLPKPFTAEFFPNSKSDRLGLAYRCRECVSRYARERNKLHPRRGRGQQYDPVKRKIWRDRMKSDPVFKLKRNINRLISQGLRAKGHKKSSRTAAVLGCSFEEFKRHLESQSGMSWENYGKGKDKWNVDHHYPQSAAKTEEEVIKLNHYTNLRPMWEPENMSKHASLPESWNPLKELDDHVTRKYDKEKNNV